MADEVKRAGRWWSGASLTELRSWQRAALRRAAKADEEAAEARRQGAMYEHAAAELEARSRQAESQAEKDEAGGDEDAVAQARRAVANLRALTQRNSRLADQKNRQAKIAEQGAYEDRTLARRLTAQIEAARHVDGPPLSKSRR